MSHGKRWRVTLDLGVNTDDSGDFGWRGEVVSEDAGSINHEDQVALVIAHAVRDTLRVLPTAEIIDARLTMECRTCGYEAPDGGPYKCKCDEGEHAP